MQDDISQMARLLGKRGGDQTKKRGRGYYARIGKLGMAKRWGKKQASSPK